MRVLLVEYVGKSSDGMEVPLSLQPDVQQCGELYVLWSLLNHG